MPGGTWTRLFESTGGLNNSGLYGAFTGHYTRLECGEQHRRLSTADDGVWDVILMVFRVQNLKDSMGNSMGNRKSVEFLVFYAILHYTKWNEGLISLPQVHVRCPQEQ